MLVDGRLILHQIGALHLLGLDQRFGRVDLALHIAERLRRGEVRSLLCGFRSLFCGLLRLGFFIILLFLQVVALIPQNLKPVFRIANIRITRFIDLPHLGQLSLGRLDGPVHS